MEINHQSGAIGALWKPNLYPVYMLAGEEDRLKDEAAQALIDKVVPSDWRDFDLETLDAGTHGAEVILSAAAQIPFGSDRRVVAVRGIEQWRDRGKQSEVERLAEGLARLPDSACLVLIAAAQEDEARRKTAVSPKLDSAVKRYGALVWCRALKGESLVRWIVARAAEAGKRFAPEGAELLAETVGHEMLPLGQEIAKLIEYVGSRSEVSARDVAAVVAAGPEDVMFATVDAITRRQADLALGLLAELHRYEPKPQAVAGKLLALLARQYRMLWQAKYLVEARINPRDVRALPDELATDLPTEGNISQFAFKAAELFAAAKSWSWFDLQRSLDRLLLCDLANKGFTGEEAGVYGSDVVRNLQVLAIELTGAA